MNEILKTIKNRRSIRNYKAEQISDSELQEILDAALYAPNAINQQKWHFTVIQSKDILNRMEDTIKENIMNFGHELGYGFLVKRASTPNYHAFYNAPTVIFISGDEKALAIEIDCGLAAQNITLAAESLNIGSCVIRSSIFLFQSKQGNEFKQELRIPTGYTHICAIALGYKNGENPVMPPRNKDVINYAK